MKPDSASPAKTAPERALRLGAAFRAALAAQPGASEADVRELEGLERRWGSGAAHGDSGALSDLVTQAERKAEQAAADREEKRRPYQADPLFMYLWRRGFGTADYRGSRLARYLDRQVAQHIRYHDARANYAMLIELPERLREHAERLKAQLAEAEPAHRADARTGAAEDYAAAVRAALARSEGGAELATLGRALLDALEEAAGAPRPDLG